MKNVSLGLYIIATPIGNLGDISKRAVEIIRASNFIICENPKHSLKLLNNLGIKKKLISLHDYNENIVVDRISKDLKESLSVLISDAGSPLISDPGYKLVQHCIKNKINITSVPGPSSLIPALQLSGLPLNEFSFIGFLPKTKKHIDDFIEKNMKSEKTIIFFVSSHKVLECLNAIEKNASDRIIAVSKELTKLNETIYRGAAKGIKEDIVKEKGNLKGEFVFVIAGNKSIKRNSEILSYFDLEIAKLLSKFSLTEVVEIVHKLTGVSKNKVYKCVLNIKNS